MPWWVWLLVGVYCLPGACVAVAMMRMACDTRWDRLAYYEDGRRPPPPGWRFRLTRWPIGFLVALAAWPLVVARELRG